MGKENSVWKKHWLSKPIYHQGQNSNMLPPGGVHVRVARHIQLGGSGGMPPWKIFEICVSEMAFLAFWQHFWAKYKHLNRICESTFPTKLQKCCPGQLPRSPPPLATPVERKPRVAKLAGHIYISTNLHLAAVTSIFQEEKNVVKELSKQSQSNYGQKLKLVGCF